MSKLKWKGRVAMRRKVLISVVLAVLGVAVFGMPRVHAQTGERGPEITGSRVDYNLTDLDPTWNLRWYNRVGLRSDQDIAPGHNQTLDLRMPRLNNNRGLVNNWTREHFLIESMRYSGQNLRTAKPVGAIVTDRRSSSSTWLRILHSDPSVSGGTAVDAPIRYHVFRFFNFEDRLRDPDDNNIGRGVPNLMVLIHGWNKDNEANQFRASRQFTLLSDNLQSVLSGNDEWAVAHYRWEPDAATGGVVAGDSWLVPQATQAAEIAHLHGQHLGELIHARNPHIENVHFIAFSAGSWAARSAAKYLQQQTGAQVQITLLDPFVPGRVPLNNSVLVRSHFEDAVFRDAAFIENYYTVDVTVGTFSQFSWSNHNSNQQQIRHRSVYAHPLPIERYAESVLNPLDYDFGWRHSLFVRNMPAVATPDLGSPSSGVQPRRFRFDWTQAAGAQQYEIMIRRMNPATGDYSFFMRRFVSNLSYQDNLDFQRGTYQWFVRGYNSLGLSGSWSSAGSFRIDGLDSPTVLRPRTDIVAANTPERYNRTLEFRSVDGANRYQLQLRLPGGQVLTSTVSSSARAGSTIAVLARNLQRDRNYHWRVRAGLGAVRVGDRESDVEWSNWSGWNRFSVSRPAPSEQFLISNFAERNRAPLNHWWRGNRFRVTRDIEVFALRGGGSGDFSMGLYEANGTIPTRLLAVANNMNGRRVTRSISPVRLRAGQDYIIAQGRRSGTSGFHYGLTNVRNVNNHPLIAAWFTPSVPMRWHGSYSASPESILNRSPNDREQPALDIGFHYRVVR